MRIVYFGTPQYAADVLDYLLEHDVDVCAVVTRPDKPKGRSGTPVPTPVKEVALKHSLPLHQPKRCSNPEFVDILATYNADLFVVVAYGEIVRDNVLELPPKGCINVHPSLLPKFRGAAPIHRAIIDGQTKTGVSIMYMVREMDAGDVIKQADIDIDPNVTMGELELDLRRLGGQLLLEVIRDVEAGPISATPQDPSGVTFAAKIELEECQLDWSLPAQQLHNLVRGTNPYPGAWCTIHIRGQERRLKILRTEIVANATGKPGEILSYGNDGLVVACGSEALGLIEIKPEGKRAMSAESMMRGIPRDDFQVG